MFKSLYSNSKPKAGMSRNIAYSTNPGSKKTQRPLQALPTPSNLQQPKLDHPPLQISQKSLRQNSNNLPRTSKESNRHVNRLYQYHRKSQQKISKLRKQIEENKKEQCTFQPKTLPNGSSKSPHKLRHQPIRSKSKFYDKRRNSELLTKNKQCQLLSEKVKQQSPAKYKRHTTNPTHTWVSQRLKSPSKTTQTSKSNLTRSPSNLSKNSRHSRARKQQIQVTYSPRFPNTIGEQSDFHRVCSQYQQILQSCCLNRHSIGYIQFCDILTKLGFTHNLTKGENMYEQRSLVYKAWGMLQEQAKVDYRWLLSFVLAVMGINQSVSQNGDNKTIVVEVNPSADKSQSDEKPTLNNFMKHKSKTISQNSASEICKTDYAELSFGEEQLGRVVKGTLYYNQGQIQRIQNIFKSFQINRLTASSPQTSISTAIQFKHQQKQSKESTFPQEITVLPRQRPSCQDRLPNKQYNTQLIFNLPHQFAEELPKKQIEQNQTLFYDSYRQGMVYPHPTQVNKSIPIKPAIPTLFKTYSNQQAKKSELVDSFINRLSESSQLEKSRTSNISKEAYQEDAEPIVHVNISLNKSRVETITMGRWSNPHLVVQKFLQTHKLSTHLAPKLLSLLQHQLNKIPSQ